MGNVKNQKLLKRKTGEMSDQQGEMSDQQGEMSDQHDLF
jgi:hypothetical protein